MNKILIFYDHFSPAYKAGGPIRSLQNLVDLLHSEAEIFVFTAAVDLDGTVLEVVKDKWVEYQEGIQVFYATKTYQTIPKILELISSVQPHSVYINGMFTPYAVLFPLVALKLLSRRQKRIRVVHSPRGMLQDGALMLKASKKRIYLQLFKLLRLHKNIHWHATDEQEREDIKKFAGKGAKIQLISNVPLVPHFQESNSKLKNSIRLVTISLIVRMKNHLFLLEALKRLPAEVQVQYDIWGPVKDADYWKRMEQEMKALPAHVRVNYKGSLQPHEVQSVLRNYDCFALPTLGENFGHAIFEALGAGLPVLISDKTPWRELEREKAGWDLPLEDPLWIAKLSEIAQMEEEAFRDWRGGAYTYAVEYLKKQNLKEQYLKLFANQEEVIP